MSPKGGKDLLAPFLPKPEYRERHTTIVRAPAALVSSVARSFTLESIPLIHAIFWLRSRILRARTDPPGPAGGGIVEMTRRVGWGVLLDQPDRAYVAGASCQPWLADVLFSPMTPEGCAHYAEPNRVRIVWSLETESLGPTLCRLSTETRVGATDAESRTRFRRYWRFFGLGILMIRVLALPAIRRQAEALCRSQSGL